MSDKPSPLPHPIPVGCTRITLEDPKDFLDWREGSGGTIEIFDIQVNSARREGKGGRLLEKLFRRLRDNGGHRNVFAITRASNLIAQQWYEAKGFNVVGVLRRFYSYEEPTVDAIMYGRHSSGPV